MPMHIYNNKMKGTVMGRAIDMENDIGALKIKVKKLEDTVRGMVSKLDSLDEKSSKTIKVDLVEDVGVDAASRTMRFFVDIYHYPVEYEEQGAVARFLNDPLRSLASHYGTDGIRDPRSILRRLVGASQK